MHILYVGPLYCGSTCLQRMKALHELGHKVTSVDTQPKGDQERKQLSLYHRIRRRLRGPMDLSNINQRIRQLIKEKSFDVVWIDRGTYIYRETLLHIKKATKSLLVHHGTDDIRYKSYRFKHYLSTIPIYDIHFTSNTFNISEMYNLGAQKVCFIELGYDRSLFRRVEVPYDDKERLGSDIFFIGHWEPKTEKLICNLVRHGLPVTVRGQDWHRARRIKLLHKVIKSGPIWGGEYVKALCSGKIGLGIVSKWNRNQTSGRIFEIPACKTFLLAERTPAIQSLYREGIEADFFSSTSELVKKAVFYLEHEKRRKELACAGYKRCVNSSYSWKDRVKEMIIQIEMLLQS